MRKKEKKMLDELLGTMKAAHEELKELIKRHNTDGAKELLAGCQEAAVAIGTAVEKSEGEGSRAVESLERYCELLYTTLLDITMGEKSARSICRRLSTNLEEAECLIKELPLTYEIFFLPYKASMWDSMESVWLEASKDDSVNCHVIPIPYYDRNPDKSFGKRKWEKDLFPSYVPTEDYRKCDLEAIRPDAVFIHNPYDGNNYVTSVEPAFYSSRLNKITDLLVYIPYFIVLGDNVPEHFCASSGVINSHITIVQSETVRQTYLRVLREKCGLTEKEFEKLGFERKILALGSPKIDKVLKTSRNDIDIPEDWQRKIYGENI